MLAFVLAGAALLLYQRLTLEDRTRQVMEPYAQLVSAGTDAAVAFEDPVRALEILNTLRANPQIREAAIVLESGRVLARFSRASGALPPPFPSRPAGVYLSADPEEMAQRARQLSAELGVSIAPGFTVFTARSQRDLPDENEWHLIRKDGSHIQVLLSVTMLRDGKSGISGFVGMLNDLGERKQARHRHHLEDLVATRTRELAQARDAAEAANRAKSAFIANMSHELRTPLNGILGYAQILQRDLSLDARQVAGLNVIRQSGEQLLTLINDILDLAKIESGRLDVHSDDIPLRKFLHTIGEIVGVRAEQKGLAFSCAAAPDLPAAIRADERLLRQTLLNLLSNAVKYTDSGQVTLRVIFLPPSRLRFAVEDTGVGIAADQLEAIFRPFGQVGAARLHAGGSGLGLTISREFVRRLGGDILVESRVGAGSTFWFEVEAPPVAAAVAIAPPPTNGVTGYRGPRRKILIVEDQAENRALLADMLEPLGFEVAQAVNGREGIERAKTLKPDLAMILYSSVDRLP